MVNQVTRKFKVRGTNKAKYLTVVKNLFTGFKSVMIEQVGRDLISHAEALSGLASVSEGEVGKTITIDLISAPNHKMPRGSVLANTELGLSWMDPIVNFLQHDKLLEDKREAHKIRIKTARFWISPTRDLYKRSYQGPYLLCVHPSLVEDILFEIHEGMCGLHSGGRSLAH